MGFEWLPISLPWTLEIVDPTQIGFDARALEVRRKTNLELEVHVTGNAPPGLDLFNGTPGATAKGTTLTLSSQMREPVTLEGYLPIKHNESGRGDPNMQHTVTAKASLATIRLANGSASSVVRWLTNVPNRNWPGITRREKTVTLERIRGPEVLKDQQSLPSGGRDHLEISLGLPTVSVVRFGQVRPSAVSEEESIAQPGFLEFRAGEHGLPTTETQYTVQRSLEFLFGCGFGVLGWSDHATDGTPLRATVASTFIPGGEETPMPPGLLHREEMNSVDEAIVSSFVREYVRLADAYDLNRVVWLYLFATRAPLDMAAGYAGAAFEVLRRGYYERPENESRARLLPKATFRQLRAAMADTIRTFAERETSQDQVEQILSLGSRLGLLNEVSGTRLNLRFLDDLSLRHGDVEESALGARNDAAHANRLTPDDYEKTRDNYRALHTLLARVLFVLLRVDTPYFDYSSLHFPLRSLEAAQGSSSS